MTDEVLFQRRGAVGLITLNRPKALNALTRGMCVAMKAMLDEWVADERVKTVVIRGTGERAFCAGGDIRSLYESGKSDVSSALDFYRDEYRLNGTIKHYPKPYVALLHGIVMGGGVGVSVHGSHRVADQSVVFAMPETGIGLFPDVGGSYFLPRLAGELGMYIALTGQRLKTADAAYAGIATHVVPSQQTEGLLAALEDGTHPDLVLRSFTESTGEPLLASAREAIDRIFSEGSVDGILATLDADESEWARGMVTIIRKKSPTSLKITFHQLREGRHLSFDDCMRMEFRMVSRVMRGHDFYEGVRATIIDKDGAPRWRPSDLSGVSDAAVAEYFAPLADNQLILT
ncbi:MAG TPA: enoyl-CoA hydratase/isomerase family protein [Rhizomicrobium sp.]|jgi:enoyl-CoA hydratase|nr:enoyl-CoA hydratase/isomerase family protein [Rhizomicrobium sp.]